MKTTCVILVTILMIVLVLVAMNSGVATTNLDKHKCVKTGLNIDGAHFFTCTIPTHTLYCINVKNGIDCIWEKQK